MRVIKIEYGLKKNVTTDLNHMKIHCSKQTNALFLKKVISIW